jgi:anti-sigma factor RsiW
MMCPHEPLVDDYLDGTLTPSQAAMFTSHLPACVSCAALVDDLRAIRTATAQLEQRPVPPHLWGRIEARVRDDHAAVPSSRFKQLLPGLRTTPWIPLAAAACLLLIAGGLWLLLPGNSAVPAQPVTHDASAPAPASAIVDADLDVVHYETAISDLQQIAKADREALDPQTSAVLDSNLSVIDMAIDESRAALNDQPANDAARDSLFEALRSKVVLLQDTVALINEMRKGDQDGVARVISGLNQ